jgi:EAL domain-containing protein (putative c-di-GMP-specific phosphodiesterase class I)
VVVRNALAQAKTWHAAGLVLDIAINVSMNSLAKLDFPDMMAREALAAGVPPRFVVIEVTESQLMTDLRAPLEVLTRLRLKGFRVSIDDFGTGHSSLVSLRDLPFDELKVDKGFVHRAATDNTLCAIYDASVRLAKQLHLHTVAEGVEDRADWDFVRRTGCDFAQGYFIARPMVAEKLPAWIKDWDVRSHADGLA